MKILIISSNIINPIPEGISKDEIEGFFPIILGI